MRGPLVNNDGALLLSYASAEGQDSHLDRPCFGTNVTTVQHVSGRPTR